MADYVKADDLGFTSQLKNFADKLPTYAATFGLLPGKLTSVADDAELMGFTVLGSNATKGYAQSWTALKNEARKGTGTTPIASYPVPVDVAAPPTAVLPGIEERFRALAAQLKAHAAYTTPIGEDLGIVADEDTTVLTAPELSVEMEGGNPVIKFVKSISDGIRLYSRRGSETAFTFLAVDTRSPYVDNRPNQNPGTPETREYYAYYIVADEQVGSQSDVISINVG